MYHNLNQLQWQLKRDSCHGHNSKTCLGHDSKTCLVVLRTQFKEFFHSKEVNASDFQNKCWQKNFIDGTKYESENYKHLLLRYLDELDKLINERVLKDDELQMKEKEVQAIKEIENRLKEKEIQQQCLVTAGAVLEACMVTKGATLKACLVNKGRALDDNLVIKETIDDSVTSSEQPDESSNSQQPHATFPQLDSGVAVQTFIPTDDPIACLHKAMAFMVIVQQVQGGQGQNVAGMGSKEKILLVQAQESGHVLETISEVHLDMFEIVFAHGIQNHEQPKSSPDAYVVNENNFDITSDIPNMDPDRGKKEHDDVNYEQQRAFFASLINNRKCDVEKYNKVNSEAQQANALLKNELERYKEKEKHFAKDMITKSEYCKKNKLLNDEIPYLKSQSCEKDKTFTKENGKFDELRKAGQTDQTLRMLLPKEDNVNTGKQGLGFENQNDYVNPSLLNKAKELAPCSYNIDEMGKDELSDHKIIKELEMTLAQQTKDIEDAKVDFLKKTDKFETYFEKLKKTKVVLERQLDRKIRDSYAKKDQFLKQIAYLESKLASQDLISNQKEYSDLRTSYNALKAKFDSLNQNKGKSSVSNYSTPKVSVSLKFYMRESSKSFPKRMSQFTTYSLQKDTKFSKKPQVYETPTPQKILNSNDSIKKRHVI
uniref:Uncharacterized protein n=1 Tax=Tanacetum cinerariifolium TaxID=118510 RepID=A0A6L2NH53_TANCI|nr:hypothetical protein [Tanacetum cinerariifolium]